MSQTIDSRAASLIATIAAGLNGGQFAHLVSDESIRTQAASIVAPIRAAKRRAANAKRYATKAEAIRAERAFRAELFREWNDYTPDAAARIDATFAIYGWAPKRSTVRDIARAILAPDAMRAIIRNRITTPDERAAMAGDATTWTIRIERRVESELSAIRSNWRETVREYRDAQRCLYAVGSFAISRFDATPSVDSRFYRNVVQHWHAYAGGRHVAIHGVTPDDIFQDAMVRAIESGDVDDNGIPVFGRMYMHTRHAVESAVYTYRRGHNHTEPFTEWTWADWSEWASANNGNFAHRTDSNPAEIAEWLAFDAARAYQTRVTEWHAAIKSRRELLALSLDDTRQALATLLNEGMTIGTISAVLGRSVAGIVKGLDPLYSVEESTLPAMPSDATPDAPVEPTYRYSMGTSARIAIRNAGRTSDPAGADTIMNVGWGIAPTL